MAPDRRVREISLQPRVFSTQVEAARTSHRGNVESVNPESWLSGSQQSFSCAFGSVSHCSLNHHCTDHSRGWGGNTWHSFLRPLLIGFHSTSLRLTGAQRCRIQSSIALPKSTNQNFMGRSPANTQISSYPKAKVTGLKPLTSGTSTSTMMPP